MNDKMPASAEAEKWLMWAEKGFNSKYGSTPLDTRIVIGRAWLRARALCEAYTGGRLT